MQKGPSQVTSGNITPSISGPKKDKDVLVISGLIIGLAAVIGAIWYYSSNEQTAPQELLNSSQVSEVLKNNPPSVMPASLPMVNVSETPAGTTKPGIVHTDLYFEVGRKGLTDEARKLLHEQAIILKNDRDLGVLIQGYTDQQGSASYNLKLGMKRAETVKAELMNAGVTEHQIKVVSLGKDGVLCIDNSDVCRQMNRRVHLEIRTFGEAHMIAPVVATTPVVDPTQASVGLGQKNDDPNSLVDSLLPSANASEGDNNNPPALEPASGS
ncbi:MAG TPA: OmpA family protein [Nitrospira sp.]|nr:OmpA family protein [Nitrospira sp.]